MKSFGIQLTFMLLGSFLPILFKSLYAAGNCWSLWYFLRDNRWRWLVGAIALLIIQFLLFFEGEQILDALKNFGFFVPAASGSVIGFAVSILIIKTIPRSDESAPQDK